VILQPVCFFESVPFIVVYPTVAIQVYGFKDFWLGVGKIGFEFIPVHQIIPIGIHISEMGSERFGVGHGGFVVGDFAGTGSQESKQNASRDQGQFLHVITSREFILIYFGLS